MIRIVLFACLAVAACNPVSTTTTTVTPAAIVPGAIIAPASVTTTSY